MMTAAPARLTFTAPDTPFYARLDEIAAMARDRAPLEHDWPAPADIAWLRAAFARNWPAAYPQPFVGTGPEDAMLSFYWKSDAATITLEIDTRSRMGDLYRTGEIAPATRTRFSNWTCPALMLGARSERR